MDPFEVLYTGTQEMIESILLASHLDEAPVVTKNCSVITDLGSGLLEKYADFEEYNVVD